MPTKEEELKEKTFKDVDELEKRIFYTLTDKKSVEVHRIAKSVSLLVKALHDKDILSEKEIDELLFECVH
jgi:hypothetical protein